jgi:hypothetical protein
MLLINAVKELEADNTELRRRLTALERRAGEHAVAEVK